MLTEHCCQSCCRNVKIYITRVEDDGLAFHANLICGCKVVKACQYYSPDFYSVVPMEKVFEDFSDMAKGRFFNSEYSLPVKVKSFNDGLLLP